MGQHFTLDAGPGCMAVAAYEIHTTTDRGGGGKPECTVPPPHILHFNH